MTIFKMKPYKLLKAKQSVVPLQILSPMCTNGFYPLFTETTGNDPPFYLEKKQTLLWQLGDVTRMEKQGLLLTAASKCTCHWDPVCKSNGEPSCMLNIVCRAERDFAARKNAWQVTVPGNLALSFWKCFKSIKKNSVLGRENTSD